MKKLLFITLATLFFIFTANAQNKGKGSVWKAVKGKDGKVYVINTAIDNIAYWQDLAKKGIVPYNKEQKKNPAVFKGTKINSLLTDFEDSPDIIIEGNDDNTQSENSIFVDPNDAQHVINSNNSTDWNGNEVNDLYGTSAFQTSDGGENWDGQIEGTGGANWGDPAVGIDLDGNLFNGYIIASSFGQGVAYSSDGGNTWTGVTLYNPGDGQDKNHLWVDNSPTSPYKGNVYSAWSDLNSSNHIYFSYSTDHGQTWLNTPLDISSDVNSGSHDQGVNLSTDADGNVYAVWAIYDSWPASETAIGFNKSTDGGESWGTATRIISNINGIRQEDGPGGIRMNSFPVMDIDLNNGNIYVVWTNIGEPGTNSGSNWSIYMIKSVDGGNTWSSPIKVNQGPIADDKHALFPWIAVDPSTGYLTVIFWDNRNTGSTDQMEVWVAVSTDEGETWEDFRVSDVAFSPSGVSGLAAGYYGDYIGIDILDGLVYPVWSDDRTGTLKAYTSPFSLNMRPRPYNLDAEIINQTTGETSLIWNFTDTAGTFQYFVIYRDNDSIGTSTDTTYNDVLPTYGYYKYSVAARHSTGLSGKVSDNVQWGSPMISVVPDSLTDTLLVNQTSTHFLTVYNGGQLPMYYNIATEFTSKYKNNKDYCTASGGGDEYISGVQFGDINITSGENGYEDHTDITTTVEAGNTYQITIQNGNPYSSDDYAVWIDANQDGDFDDPGEQVVCAPDAGNSSSQTFDITIPEDAIAGTTTMRIRLKWRGSDCGDPCGTTSYGEVEDYGIIINAWLAVDNKIDTVNPGETVIVPVHFSSQNIAMGTYRANLHFYSNADTVVIPVSLVVTDTMPMDISPTAVPQNICDGDSTTLFANATGGSGTYTYSWTSNPQGFTSSEANPTVSPTETTTYTVEVNDGNNTMSGSVTVTVNSAVNVPDKPYGPVSVGNHTSAVKYHIPNAPNGYYSFEWSMNPNVGGIAGTTDTVLISFNTDYTGSVFLKVRGINDCGQSDWSDSLEITLFEGTIVTANDLGITLYPNPNDGKFQLGIMSIMHDVINIEIYNNLGQKVYAEDNLELEGLNVKEINMPKALPGIYYLHVTGNGISETLKFMIR